MLVGESLSQAVSKLLNKSLAVARSSPGREAISQA